MKKFMKKLAKKAEGFTLVELVVVIAILGILAGIAVPAYSGYLEKAHEAADMTTLDAVKTAAMGAVAQDGAVTKIVVAASSGAVSSITVTTDNGSAGNFMDDDNDYYSDFILFYGDDEIADLTSKEYASGATWRAAEDEENDKPAGWNKN